MNTLVRKERAIRNMNDQKKGQSYGTMKPRGRRTFSERQMLISAYALNAYPSMDVRAKLSKSLGLTDTQVQNWFRYRRDKDKKTSVSSSSEDSTSESESESDLDSDSSHFNEPLVPLSRVNELTQPKMTLESLADCVVQLGEPLSNNGPEVETRDAVKDSQPKEKMPAASKQCVTTRKINITKHTKSEKLAPVKATKLALSKDPMHNNKKGASSFLARSNTVAPKLALAKASVNASKDPMHNNKKRASSFLAKSKIVAPIGDEFGQSAKRSKTLISNTETISSDSSESSDSLSQPMDVGIENEVERPQCELKKPMTSSSTPADIQQKASELNNHVNQDVEKLDRFRTEKLRIKEEEKQAKVRALEAQERAFQKQERLLELQCKALERQEKKEDLELFLKLHDHSSGPMVRVMLEQKREIAEKWGWKWE